MDENDIRLLAGERFQSGVHRGLPRRAAAGGRFMAQCADGVVEHCGVVGVEDRLHCKNLWMTTERLHGAEYDGLPAD
jgi:hypothetical protein